MSKAIIAAALFSNNINGAKFATVYAFDRKYNGKCRVNGNYVQFVDNSGLIKKSIQIGKITRLVCEKKTYSFE